MRVPLILFIILPIVELILFIEVGSIIGSGYVIISIVLTALIGYLVIKLKIKNIHFNLVNIINLQDLYKEYTSGVYSFLGSILLIIPGYLTDILGLAMILKIFSPNLQKYSKSPQSAKKDNQRRNNKIIDGEYRKDE